MKELLVVGTGYVGLVTGACFAEMGFTVTCLDIDNAKIQFLQQGGIPIYEPGLEEIIKRNIESKRITFTTEYKQSVERAQVIFLALPTPALPDGRCDLTALFHASHEIAANMHHSKTIVVKSTVPVGTCALLYKNIRETLERDNRSIPFDVVSNPEFLKEGAAVQDFMRPCRVIIGCKSEKAAALMKELYRPFMLSHERMIFMDVASAELTKYAANAMLATRISFMNWLSQLAEKTGADITHIRRGIGSDKRIGYDFLWAGAGFGGSCLPKDTKALKHLCDHVGVPNDLITAVIDINERQKMVLAEKIEAYFLSRGGLKGKTCAILGLSFKPDTDDMRESPSLSIIEALRNKGCTLRLYDPVSMDGAKKWIRNSEELKWCSSELEAAKEADAIVLVTEWKQFRLLRAEELLQEMKGKAFFDGRNQYDPIEMAQYGFDYFSIGRAEAYHTVTSEFVNAAVLA